MIQFHAEGGMPYMVPLTLMLLVNVGLLVRVFILRAGGKPYQKTLFIFKQVGLLALVWGVFGTLTGLFAAFRSLSEIKEALPIDVIMGGLKVALITAVYGMVIFLVSFLAYIGIVAVSKKDGTVPAE